MEFSRQPTRDLSKVNLGETPSLAEGVLPTIPLPAPSDLHGTLAPDGSLCVGLFKLPLEIMSARLRDAARLTDRIPRVFPTVDRLQGALIDSDIRVPPGSMNFPSAFATFRRAMEGSLRGSSFTDMARALEHLSVGQVVAPPDISRLREVLVEAAQVATVCVGIDASHYDALNHRSPLQRGKDWLVDKIGAMKAHDPRIRARLTLMPFEDLSPTEIRVDMDVWAQRLSLAGDGSRLVRSVCAAEHHVADMLHRGSFEREVRSCQGGLRGMFTFSCGDSDGPFTVEHTITDVFAALQLGQSASRLLAHLHDQKVDLSRLCRFVDRESATGLGANLRRLSPQVHYRLDDVAEWAERFDVSADHVLSDEERHDLAVLLLDAEICLYAVCHLHHSVAGEVRRAFWRSMWPASVHDREVSHGIELANALPAPLLNDCHGAAQVVTNAAMLLGFSGEDRGGGAMWRIPENPLASATWAITRAGGSVERSSRASSPYEFI